ncbi:hypothetical protein C0991_005876 [Blastosporella zonata]|nr:hypothetical protein C0991_005876 [Blastosporella zonata]
MALQIDSFIFHAAGSNLQSSAKRYTSRLGSSNDGLTLLFAHGVGSRKTTATRSQLMHHPSFTQILDKEQWEPTIEQIFCLQQNKATCDRIREAWAFDWQSHGDAAVLNEKVLESRQDVIFFLVEPTILSQELFDAHAKEREDFAIMSMKVTLARRDSWPDKRSAAAYLRRRLPWKHWDSRVFDAYINHGLRMITTSTGEALGLKTSKRQEGMSYPQFAPYIESVTLFRERCMDIPFHIIFGEKIDFMPRYIQEDLYNAVEGSKLVSLTRVPNAGHLVVQENPDGLSVVICDRLGSKDTWMKSRM